jgi:hypothetical protein
MILDTQSLLYLKKMVIGRAGFALKPARYFLEQGDVCNEIPISKASLDADFVGVTSQVFENLCNRCIETVRTMAIQ